MNVDLELYRIFYTVACSGNISQAAEILYIREPAVSKSIKKLETITGITLFYRNSRGVRLTDEGKVFFDYIERAMKEISVGEKIITKLKRKEQGIIKIGVSTTLCTHFLIPHLKEFINEHILIIVDMLPYLNQFFPLQPFLKFFHFIIHPLKCVLLLLRKKRLSDW